MKKLVILAFLACFSFGYSQVGIGTTNPLSTLDINGNLSLKVVSLNGGAPGSATPIDDGVYINLTPTVGMEEFILPDAAAFPGRIYILRNITNTVTAEIYSFGGLFFPGDARTATAAPINMIPDAGAVGGARTKTLIFVSDGVNWTYGHLGTF